MREQAALVWNTYCGTAPTALSSPVCCVSQRIDPPRARSLRCCWNGQAGCGAATARSRRTCSGGMSVSSVATLTAATSSRWRSWPWSRPSKIADFPYQAAIDQHDPGIVQDSGLCEPLVHVHGHTIQIETGPRRHEGRFDESGHGSSDPSVGMSVSSISGRPNASQSALNDRGDREGTGVVFSTVGATVAILSLNDGSKTDSRPLISAGEIRTDTNDRPLIAPR